MRTCCLVVLVALTGVLLAGNACAQIGEDAPKYDDRVGQCLRDKEIEYEIDKDGDYKVIYKIGEDRTQLCYIISDTSTLRNLEIREIWSFAYRLEGENVPEGIANTLLRDAFKRKLGSWGILGDKAVFVVRISANADKETLVNALELAMVVADAMEEELSGDKDEF